jgi:hypothetical protein
LRELAELHGTRFDRGLDWGERIPAEHLQLMESLEENDSDFENDGRDRMPSRPELASWQPPALETVAVLARQFDTAFQSANASALEACERALVERVPLQLLQQTWLEKIFDRRADASHEWTYADIRFALHLASAAGHLEQRMLRTLFVSVLAETASGEAPASVGRTSVTTNIPRRVETRAFAALYRHVAEALSKPSMDTEGSWLTLVQLIPHIDGVSGSVTSMHVDALALCVAHDAWNQALEVVLARITPFWYKPPSPFMVSLSDLERFLFSAATTHFKTGNYRASWRLLHEFLALQCPRPMSRRNEAADPDTKHPSQRIAPLDTAVTLCRWHEPVMLDSSRICETTAAMRIRAAQRYVCSELIVYGTTEEALRSSLPMGSVEHSPSTTGRFLARYRALAQTFDACRAAGCIAPFDAFVHLHLDSFRADTHEEWILQTRRALARVLMLSTASVYKTLPLRTLSERTGLSRSEIAQVIQDLRSGRCWSQSAGALWTRWFTTLVTLDANGERVSFRRHADARTESAGAVAVPGSCGIYLSRAMLVDAGVHAACAADFSRKCAWFP